MIDPISLSAAVSAANIAYNGIKKAISVSRDIEDFTGEIGKWMTAVSDVDNINKRASNPSQIDRIFNGSVEEVALQSFAAKKKLEKQREDIIKEEGRIRKARQEAVYAKEQRQQELRDATIITVACLIGAGAVGSILWLIFLA